LTIRFGEAYRLAMSALIIELRPQAEQNEFNLRRWDEVLADPDLAKIEGRVETDRHGQVIMSPPPSARHAWFQFRVAHVLRDLLPTGEVLTECPVSTADGVRSADIAWASEEKMRDLGNRACFPSAPETCIEILSARNTRREIEEKIALYFDAGAQEVWVCGEAGKVAFYSRPGVLAGKSILCPEFPEAIAPRQTGDFA
jgi:Uma2 family endonuclease